MQWVASLKRDDVFDSGLREAFASLRGRETQFAKVVVFG